MPIKYGVLVNYVCMLASLYVMNNYRYQPNKHIARVHNISIEGECLTAYIPHTNVLRQVTPVNYRILTYLIYA